MRISDWSSDVCSSDLGNGGASLALYAAAAGLQCCIVTTSALSPVFRRAIIMTGAQIVTASDSLERWDHIANRSEEHASELQSLMRISYAVFCLKKKKHRLPHPHTQTHILD